MSTAMDRKKYLHSKATGLVPHAKNMAARFCQALTEKFPDYCKHEGIRNELHFLCTAQATYAAVLNIKLSEEEIIAKDVEKIVLQNLKDSDSKSFMAYMEYHSFVRRNMLSVYEETKTPHGRSDYLKKLSELWFQLKFGQTAAHVQEAVSISLGSLIFESYMNYWV